MKATYEDGTPVREGDRIRHTQSAGGLLPSSGAREGVAAKFPRSERELEAMRDYNEKVGYVALDPDELVLKTVDHAGRDWYYYLHGKVERL